MRQIKWISYLQQFYLVNKHDKGKANVRANCIIYPPVTSLLTVLSMHGYHTVTCTQLYEQDTKLSLVYREF